MAKRRPPLLWLFVVVLVVAIAWYVVTPRRAFRDFATALQIGDLDGMQRTIDFARLRENARRDLGAILLHQARSRGDTTGKTPPDLLDRLANSVTTPAGVVQLVGAFGVTPGGLSASPAFRYRSISRVDVRLHLAGQPDDSSGILTFERTGFHWRLARVWSHWVETVTEGK